MKRKDIPNRLAQRISFGIIAIVFAIIFATIFVGCRAQKSMTETHTETRDSSATNLKIEHDTIIVHDTVYINEKTVKDAETQSETTLHFGEGGGTYNSKTGDATNVTGVGLKESKREHELSERVERLTSENTTLHHSVDSLNSIISNSTSDAKEDIEPVTMNWWQRFMYTSGIVAWCVLIIIAIYFIIKLLRKFKVIPV